MISKEDTMAMNVCGVVCSRYCPAFGKECQGCSEMKGRIPWAAFYNLEVCPVYTCVQEHGFSDCGECGKAPCEIWKMTLNPNASPEEHAEDYRRRLEALASIKR